MTVSNNQSPNDDKRSKLGKRPKFKERLSFATWILLIISFTLLGYALYVIDTRVLATDADTAKAAPTMVNHLQ